MLDINGLAVVFGLQFLMVDNLSIKGIAIPDIIAHYAGAYVGVAYRCNVHISPD